MMNARPLTTRFAVAAALASLAITACTSESDVRVQVTGTNDTCTPSTDEAAAGDITFEFRNEADQVNELYVLRSDGSVASEVENVSTGTTRSFTVSLSAGEYTLTCKPGQAGDGFSSTFAVTGEGGDTVPASGTEVAVSGTEYAFELAADPTFEAGTTYTFEFTNRGTIQHEMEVFGPDGGAIGEVGPTEPGATGRVTLALESAGTYRLVCGIDDHEAEGMAAAIEVS